MFWLSPKWMFAGVKKENGPKPFHEMPSSQGQGVPLKGPFLGHFSQGNLSKVNENVHFSDFRMFCYFDPRFSWLF